MDIVAPVAEHSLAATLMQKLPHFKVGNVGGRPASVEMYGEPSITAPPGSANVIVSMDVSYLSVELAGINGIWISSHGPSRVGGSGGRG